LVLGELGIGGCQSKGFLLCLLCISEFPVLIEHGFICDNCLSVASFADDELVTCFSRQSSDKNVIKDSRLVIPFPKALLFSKRKVNASLGFV
jgi:hypothetical protein